MSGGCTVSSVSLNVVWPGQLTLRLKQMFSATHKPNILWWHINQNSVIALPFWDGEKGKPTVATYDGNDQILPVWRIQTPFSGSIVCSSDRSLGSYSFLFWEELPSPLFSVTLVSFLLEILSWTLGSMTTPEESIGGWIACVAYFVLM